MDTKDILNAELSYEQNGNMLDGIINNESTSREIPGTYDESEREADEAEHERIIKDMNENSELDKAKDLISEYSREEFGDEANLSDLTSIGLAYTTIDYPEFLKMAGVTDYEKEFEIQVDANLIDKEIITYIDGDELHTEKFDSLADMNEFLEGLDFNNLIHIGDAGWQKIADREIDREAAESIDAHEAEVGSDGSRVFPNLNEEPKEKLYVCFRNNAESKELSNYLTNKGFSFHFQEAQRELTTIMIGQGDIEAVRGILKDKGIINSINPLEPAEILAVKLDDFIFYHDPYSYYDALIGDRENNINIITQDIRNGNISEIKSFLANIVEESDSPEEIKEAGGLISELSNYDIINNDLSKTAEKSDFLTVSISSKLISEPFMAKDGNEYVRVRIPNENRNDKTPWASLVIPPGYVTKDENTGRSAIKIREDGYSTLTKSEYKGNDANGKAIFSQSKSKVANRDIKNRVERSAPRNIHQLIKENKEKASILEKNRNLEVEKNRDISKRNRNTDRT